MNFGSLLTSRRVCLAIAGIVAVALQTRFNLVVDPTQLTEILVLVGGWIAGDAIAKHNSVGAGLALPDKWKALLQDPKFLATVAGIVVVIGNDRFGLHLEELQVQQIIGMIVTIVVAIGARPVVPPPPTV